MKLPIPPISNTPQSFSLIALPVVPNVTLFRSGPILTIPLVDCFTLQSSSTCVVDGSVLISGPIVISSGNVQILGNLTLTPTTTISITYPYTISTTGCIQFDGILSLNVSRLPENGNSDQIELEVLTYTCRQGNFSNFNIDIASQQDDCKEVADSQLVYSPLKLSVLLTLAPKDSPNCPRPVQDNNNNTLAIAVGVSVGGVVLIVVVILILFFTVPKLRAKIQPFRERRAENQTAKS